MGQDDGTDNSAICSDNSRKSDAAAGVQHFQLDEDENEGSKSVAYDLERAFEALSNQVEPKATSSDFDDLKSVQLISTRFQSVSKLCHCDFDGSQTFFSKR